MMEPLETQLCEVRSKLKAEWAPSTFAAFGFLVGNLERFANEHGYETACQELYDAWLSSKERSRSVRERQTSILRRLDALAGTHAIRPNGKLYNPLPFPDGDELLKMAQTPFAPEEPHSLLLVVAHVYRILVSFGESPSTLSQYLNVFREIHRFFTLKHETDLYDRDLVTMYMEERTERMLEGELTQWKWKIRRRSVTALNAVAERGTFSWEDLRLRGGNRLPVLADFEVMRDVWRQRGVMRNLEPATIEFRDYICRLFLALLGCTTVEELKGAERTSVQCVMEAFGNYFAPSSLSTVLPVVRELLGFIHEYLHTEISLAGMVMIPALHSDHDNTHLSAEDEQRVLAELSRLPHRDQAIILLALKTGLRNSDICSLRLDALDWRKMQIHIRQEKTHELLCLPLLPTVADPLARYILDDRPSGVDCPFVFLRMQPPNQRITDAYAIISRFLQSIPCIPEDGVRMGPHMLRHTLVHRMLEARIPIQVISDTLGHTSKESVKAYISADEGMLRECALGFDDLPRKTWEGGAS